MELLRQGDAVNARPYLEKAVSVAPSNPLTHAALAADWSALGLDIRAGQEAKLAFESSGGMGRIEQLEIEARYRMIDHDWPRAIQVYQALFTLLPDSLEDGLQLASAEAQGGKGQDALSTVAALRHLGSPLGNDPRVDLAEARAAGAMGDFVHTRKAAQAAAEKAKARGTRLQYARARLMESGAMQTLAIAGYADKRAEARTICAELGDRTCVVAAYRIEANAMATQGKLAAARPLYQSALEVSNQIGNSLEELNALNGLAYVARPLRAICARPKAIFKKR
jgi:tetratricopeptide (TPR) repeat protein